MVPLLDMEWLSMVTGRQGFFSTDRKHSANRRQQPQDHAGSDIEGEIRVIPLLEKGYALKGVGGKGGISAADARDQEKAPFQCHPGVSSGKAIEKADQEAAGNIHEKRSQRKGGCYLLADGDLYQVAADATQGASESDDYQRFHGMKLTDIGKKLYFFL